MNTAFYPSEPATVNEKAVRISSGITLVLVTASIFLSTPYNLGILVFLLIDYLSRILRNGKFSLLGQAGGLFARLFRIVPKTKNASPRKFAYGVGAVFTVAMIIALLLSYKVVFIVVSVLFVSIRFFDTFVAFSIECSIYQMLLDYQNAEDGVLRISLFPGDRK